MSRLLAGFATRMRKRDAGSEGESTPIFDGKCPKRSLRGLEGLGNNPTGFPRSSLQ